MDWIKFFRLVCLLDEMNLRIKTLRQRERKFLTKDEKSFRKIFIVFYNMLFYPNFIQFRSILWLFDSSSIDKYLIFLGKKLNKKLLQLRQINLGHNDLISEVQRDVEANFWQIWVFSTPWWRIKSKKSRYQILIISAFTKLSCTSLLM